MPDQVIRFDDGAAYERYMGKWSQLAGEVFLDWLGASQGLRWLDVGCGNGAFTEMVVNHCSPNSVCGIDPSEGQLVFARERPALRNAELRQADAMALPYADRSFDVAVMPLVIFFVPDPAKGVAEMKRVVSSGGIVCAYSWDMVGGGFPYAVLHEEMRTLGVRPGVTPSEDASQMNVMLRLWKEVGCEEIQTHEITVQRTFDHFDDYWATIQGGPSVSKQLKSMTPEVLAMLKARMRSKLREDDTGRITYTARANAIKGRVPN
jgi:ubiquinone/menaquinone biosynthesis C-methylase UbiE